MDNKENSNLQKIYTRTRLRFPKMSLSPQNSSNYTKYKKIVKIIVILFIAYLVVYYTLKAIEPILNEQCMSMAKSIATKISNDEATAVMANYKYEDILNITKDNEGNVKLVGTNIIIINEITSEIPVRMQRELDKNQNNEFSIKLGSFLGSNLFAGRGPNIPIKLQTTGTVETDLKSEFTSAGINQTLHRIYLEVKCNVVILTPYNTIKQQITNQVLLAEGVIVGDVPSSYYNLEGMTNSDAINVIE